MSILSKRKSIRAYDVNHIMSDNDLTNILNLANRAPSSQNLQPTRLVIIKSNEGKELIKPALYGNLTQLETSNALIVVFTDVNKYRNAEKILNMSYEKGYMPLEVKEKQLKTIEHVKSYLTEDKILQDGILDAGLYSMQLMLAAKEYGYDTCPIGGFNKDVVNEILNIEKELVPVLMISIGKAKESGFDSTRLDLTDIIKYI